MADTVYIFGAGSTAYLEMPITDKQIDLFMKSEQSDDLLSRLKQIVMDLFGCNEGKTNCSINDIYNLIDSNLLLHNGLFSDNARIEYYELEKCKKKLIAMLFTNVKTIIDRIARSDQDKYEKYLRFYYELAKKEMKKKMESSLTASHRDYFLSSYSIVNFNWDLFSLMPIVEAHNRLNHENEYFFPTGRNPQQRIYVDFNCEYAKAKNDNDLWYPVTEQAAFHINSPKYDAKRRIILTRCFYPHGAMNLFKCSYCAKHSFFMGDLKLPSVVERMHYDSSQIYKCPYCGNDISGMDFDVLVQSNFKTRNSYLEEIRLSMINELRNAKRLVIIGYSLPRDDADYITMFKSLNNIKEVYVVLRQAGSDNRFIESSKLRNDAIHDVRESVDNYRKTFSGKRLFFNLCGAPDAFDAVIRLPEIEEN